MGRAAKVKSVSPKPSAKVARERQRLLAAPKAGVMDTIAQDVRHAARRLLRAPIFTAAAAATLALAIAANAAIFTLVYRVVLRPLPYANSERLLALDHGIPSRNVPSGVNVMTWQLYHQLADHARTLDSVAAYFASGGTLTGAARRSVSRSRVRRLLSCRYCAWPLRAADGSQNRKARRVRLTSPCCPMASGSAGSARIPRSSVARS
jgi:hypothetical protein